MTTTATAGFMAMKGAGYYSQATTGAREVMERAVPLISGAIAAIGHEDGDAPWRFADMGCADGGTSMPMWREVLAAFRAKQQRRPVELVYTDLPRNDFSQLFRNVHNQTGLKSYYGDIPGIYPFASATSFHQAIFPANSLHLAFSATASHYISKAPCDIPDHVHMVGAKGAARAAYVETGRVEWDAMLAQRARELVPGGRLVFLNFGIDAEGRYLGHTGGVSMFDAFARHWRSLVADGTITEAEYAATNFPQVYRTAREFTAPLSDASSAAHRAGLRLDHVEERHLVCPYARAFAEHGDAQRFARDYIPTLRSWSEPTFAAGLSPARPPGERAAIIDEFYGRYERDVAAAPAGHGMDYIHVHLVCRKA